METVTIGCRLPNGYTIEVGLKVTERAGNGSVTQLMKTENYKRVSLRGTREHNREMFRRGFRPPAQLAAEPFINQNVPKDVWDAWVKDHKSNWVLTSGNIFEVKDGKNSANVDAAIIDAAARPRILEPVDPSKAIKVGASIVEVAEFHEENVQQMAGRQ